MVGFCLWQEGMKMKRAMKSILGVMVLIGIISLGTKIVNAENLDNNQKEVKVEEEQETVSKGPAIDNTTMMAGPEIEPITGEEAVRLLSQIDYETLNLSSPLENYRFAYEKGLDDIDGILVYVVKAYEIEGEYQEPAGIYYVTTDGNGMYKKEHSTGSCINLETGEVIEGKILETQEIEE